MVITEFSNILNLKFIDGFMGLLVNGWRQTGHVDWQVSEIVLELDSNKVPLEYSNP